MSSRLTRDDLPEGQTSPKLCRPRRNPGNRKRRANAGTMSSDVWPVLATFCDCWCDDHVGKHDMNTVSRVRSTVCDSYVIEDPWALRR